MSPSGSQKEAFPHVVIDAQLNDVGWNLTDGQSVRYEYQLADGTFADYVLSDCNVRAMAVVEGVGEDAANRMFAVLAKDPSWHGEYVGLETMRKKCVVL